MIGTELLSVASRHGRIILVIGLIAGITLPGLADYVRSVLPQLVALLLFTNAFRIGAKSAFSGVGVFGETLLAVLGFQLLLPCFFVFVFYLFGFSGDLATALIIMCAASAIAGSPNLVQLSGHNPAPALALLVTGTALLPVTTLLVLLVYPDLGSLDTILSVSARLAIVIFLAAGSGFIIRHLFLKEMTPEQSSRVDGFSVILMAVLVIGLMSALGPSLLSAPGYTAFILAITCLANFGLQVLAFCVFGSKRFRPKRISYSIVAGNRNMALFLTALPVSIVDPILLFIACYQIPMYLTPIVMRWLYR